MTQYYFTSESVSEGHPDKICDRLSDEILDYCLTKDSVARCATEVLATTNHVTIAGEVRGKGITDAHGAILESAKNDMCTLVRMAIKDIGYEQDGFHWNTVNIDFRLHGQSPEIAQGVDAGTGTFTEEGAGDQGIMFGYATDETEHYMPAPLYYSHRILQALSKIRRSPDNPGFGPDMKSQVTLKYDNNAIIGIGNVVVSAQHTPAFQNDIHATVAQVVESILPYAPETLYVNPTGAFVIGGPDGDAGLTGRKIIVDTYGGSAPHGGGAFSGKDPSKVDRSAAYAGRYLAKNIVASGLAKRCLVQLSYAIGVAKPMSIYIDTYGTGTVDHATLVHAIEKSMDLTPYGIRTHLQLNRPIYVPTSSYGHFGREAKDGLFPWEALDLGDTLHKNIS